METILEQQRRYHEERERLIKLMVDEHATKKPSVSTLHTRVRIQSFYIRGFVAGTRAYIFRTSSKSIARIVWRCD